MKDLRVASFPIPGLEYVFVPPGLPLVAKTAASGPTTSILVRGGAGTGKTTLAVALAHAISRECEGVALYLTTEFVATEIAYKAATLDLPEDGVVVWDAAGDHAAGTIFARHLLQTRAGADEQDLLTIRRRKHAALEAIWESVAPTGKPSAEGPGERPIRAIVIDAFGLPDEGDEDPELRNELLSLIQALEHVGISTILVEEAGELAQTWLSFVVDIVFEIELSTHAATGNLLLRQLRCPKSRYGQALPGPHDYGLDLSNRPAVWPDLVFANAGESLARADNLPPTFFVPQGDRFGLYPAGSVIISDWSVGDRPFMSMFEELPGMVPARVTCGPLTRVSIDESAAYISEGQGLFALVWFLLHAHRGGRINAVGLTGFDYFLSNLDADRGIRAIAMLSAAKLSVCLHGDTAALEQLGPVVSCVQGGQHISDHNRRRPAPRLCRADRWLPKFAKPLSDEEPAERALATHLDGDFRTAAGKASGLAGVAAARYYMRIGDDLKAATLLRPVPAYPEHIELWASLSAIHAHNTTALERLATAPTPLDVDDTIALLRALAAQDQIDRLDAVIDQCRARWKLPDWYADRLKAELWVDTLDLSNNKAEVAQRVRQSLETLAEHQDTPAAHRAEIFYNLAVLDDARGDAEAAQAARRRAKELNPDLDLETPP